MTDLGTLGGFSYAVAINDPGEVVGYSFSNDGDQHAFVWRNGTMTDLGGYEARAINNAGQVVGVGFVEPADGLKHAFLWYIRR